MSAHAWELRSQPARSRWQACADGMSAALAAAQPAALEDASADASADALRALPWGRQTNRRVFVTERSHWPHRSGHTRTLWVDRLAVLSCEDRGPARWHDLDESRAERAAERDRNRAAAEDLRCAQQEVHAALTREERVWFYPGQMGGVLYLAPQRGEWGGCRGVGTPVPAHGAMRRAGLDPDALPANGGWYWPPVVGGRLERERRWHRDLAD